MFDMMKTLDQAGVKGKAQASPMEGLLKSMGLGEVIEAARKLADSGSVQKITAFADALPIIMERLERIEQAQELTLDRLTTILGSYTLSYSGPSDGGPIDPGMGEEPSRDNVARARRGRAGGSPVPDHDGR
jgi:hypothetical protein